MDAMDSFEPILVDVDCSRYEEDAFSLLDKSRDVNVVRDLRSSTVAAFDQTSFPQLNISSRTQLKQQLYREQTKNSEPARGGRRSGALDGGSGTVAGSGPVLSVQFPLESIDIELPKKVLQVETRLENPTRYHVIQKQKTQVREYVTAALKLTKQNLVRESCRHTRLMILGRLYDSFISTKPPAPSAAGGGGGAATTQPQSIGGSSAGSTASFGSNFGKASSSSSALVGVVAGSAATAVAVAMASATSSAVPAAGPPPSAASSATPTPIEQQAEWRLEMKLSCRFGNKLYRTFVDEFDYVRDLLMLIRFEIPKWVFVVSEFEDEISSYECNRAARAAQQAAAVQFASTSAATAVAAAAAAAASIASQAAQTGDFLTFGRPGLLAGSEKGAKHEKFIEPEVRDRIKKDNHNCSRYHA
ncbi:uncharacterized protein LOC126579961 [Anopheles aquasalis]|uniref:uncharacterized protein LOC126579961 n=1 Tax=Anopheles aquasalis TaxID=42839 RepID=UPI00215B2A0B|nr:uncharacterized protein LOC126579961 [Anopheles aquasalis]XP_050099712.1 uncharacterized protein LOC126579961 [Anopheles aquasalis]XP_050099713.1 uncharacterized protein LOC126579961 [Anopheles aquasalis]